MRSILDITSVQSARIAQHVTWGNGGDDGALGATRKGTYIATAGRVGLQGVFGLDAATEAGFLCTGFESATCALLKTCISEWMALHVCREIQHALCETQPTDPVTSSSCSFLRPGGDNHTP
jgi:hypothetical protein